MECESLNMSTLLVFGVANSIAEKLLTLAPVDKVIIAIYFVIVLAIGFYLKQFVGTGEDFFMAGRKMTAWIAGLSFISANLSSLETMGWSAMAYQYGMLAAHAYLISGAFADPVPGRGDDALLLYMQDALRARLSEPALWRGGRARWRAFPSPS